MCISFLNWAHTTKPLSSCRALHYTAATNANNCTCCTFWNPCVVAMCCTLQNAQSNTSCTHKAHLIHYHIFAVTCSSRSKRPHRMIRPWTRTAKRLELCECVKRLGNIALVHTKKHDNMSFTPWLKPTLSLSPLITHSCVRCISWRDYRG